jgi:hypothetical protein
VALAGGVASLLTAEPTAVSIALFAVVIVAGTGGIRARDEFRRGWRQGYESAARVMYDRTLGRTTDIEARAVAQGDPTPEPWEPHVSVRTARSAR